MSVEAIDLLDPRITRRVNPVGTDVLLIKNPSTGKDHWVFLQDLFTPVESQYETWKPLAEGGSYDTTDRVTWQFRLWESLIDNNEDIPPSEGAAWHEVSEPGPVPVSQEYVDTLVLTKLNGIAWKQPVKARTTAALPANTVGGGNTTLTANANGAFPNQDGVAIALNDDLLVMNEASQTKNGIYRLTQAGSAGTPWILTRRDDANSPAELQNAVTSVNEGTSHANTSWRQNTDNVVIGTSNIVWVIFGSAGINGSTGSTDNAILRADGTGGNALQNSPAIVDDTGSLTLGLSSLSGSGRNFQVDGSATDVGLSIFTKGAGTLIAFTGGGFAARATSIALSGSNNVAQFAYAGSGLTNQTARIGITNITGGTPANNIGAGIDLIPNGSSAGQIDCVQPNVASQNYDLIFRVKDPSSIHEVLRLKADKSAVFAGPVVLPSYSVVGVPAAASFTGGLIYVNNESGGAVLAFSDGINWRRVTDRNVVS